LSVLPDSKKWFLLKVKLTLGYVHNYLDHYHDVKQTLANELASLAFNYESRSAIYGTTEFAELVFVGLRNFGIEELSVSSSESALST